MTCKPQKHDATTIEGSLAYGIRRLRPGALQRFQTDFRAYIAENAHCLHAALAFPEPNSDDNNDEQNQRLHMVLWYRNTEGDDDKTPTPSCPIDLFSEAFGPPQDGNDDDDDDDPSDGVFHTYGKRADIVRQENGTERCAVHYSQGCKLLAGYLRPPPPPLLAVVANGNDNDAALPDGRIQKKDPATSTVYDSHAEPEHVCWKRPPRPLPMIGIFRRAVRPGLRPELAKSFQPVCNIWHSSVPGILGAMVVADPDDENCVHDVRIFADKASYDAHVDKSNPHLVQAMENWFSHYDTSVPHKGIMVAEDTSDPATRTSSIQNRPVQVDFRIFHYGQGNCMGRVLDSEFAAAAECS